MTTFLTLLLVLAMVGVLGVLGMGVATMIRGGNPRLSNRFMQARVVMQGVALVELELLMLVASNRCRRWCASTASTRAPATRGEPRSPTAPRVQSRRCASRAAARL